MALRQMVMQLDNTKAPPNLGIRPFHAKMMTVGMNKISTNDLRLRHCAIKSARNNEDKTALVAGMVVVGIYNFLFYERTVRPVRPMNTSSSVIFPLREALITSGSSRC